MSEPEVTEVQNEPTPHAAEAGRDAYIVGRDQFIIHIHAVEGGHVQSVNGTGVQPGRQEEPPVQDRSAEEDLYFSAPELASWRQSLDGARIPLAVGSAPRYAIPQYTHDPLLIIVIATWAVLAIILAWFGSMPFWFGVAALAGIVAHLAGWISDVRIRRLGLSAAMPLS